MEECNNNRGGELQLQSSSSRSRSIPQQYSPNSFRRRESKGSRNASFSWIGSNRLVLLLILVSLWAYLGFFVQSKWDHYEKEQELKGFDFHLKNHQDSVVKKSSLFVDNEKVGANNLVEIVLAKKRENGNTSSKKRKSRRSLRSKHKRKLKVDGNFGNIEEKELEIPLVGPFGSMEDKILKLSTNEKGYGKCDKKSEFAKLFTLKSFVLIFHELSMTGAPLSMMELATELMSCGANVSAVVLSRKGGLMQELVRRQIKVIDDKVDHSFKTSMNADLVIAGSAVCASWIGMNKFVNFLVCFFVIFLVSGCFFGDFIVCYLFN